MLTREVLADAYTRIRQVVHAAAADLDADGLAYRPEPGANSIAWLVWHLTRVQDDHLSDIAGREQALTADGWHAVLDLPFAPAETGTGHTPEQVAAVRPNGPQPLLGYHDAVIDRSLTYLATVEGDELDRIVDASWDPPTTAGVRLVSVLSDNLQHAGQARYLRGIVDRGA